MRDNERPTMAKLEAAGLFDPGAPDAPQVLALRDLTGQAWVSDGDAEA